MSQGTENANIPRCPDTNIPRLSSSHDNLPNTTKERAQFLHNGTTYSDYIRPQTYHSHKPSHIPTKSLPPLNPLQFLSPPIPCPLTLISGPRKPPFTRFTSPYLLHRWLGNRRMNTSELPPQPLHQDLKHTISTLYLMDAPRSYLYGSPTLSIVITPPTYLLCGLLPHHYSPGISPDPNDDTASNPLIYLNAVGEPQDEDIMDLEGYNSGRVEGKPKTKGKYYTPPLPNN